VADPFVAEIRLFPFNFAPRGWASCDGQLLPIAQNTALFALLGTTYGGNGQSNFALPDLQGRAPMHHGQGPGLSLHDLGEAGGEAAVTLLPSEMPAHQHTMQAKNDDALDDDPEGALLARSVGAAAYVASSTSVVAMAPEAVAPAGSSSPHNNMQPYLTVQFCIAMQGVFPPRT